MNQDSACNVDFLVEAIHFADLSNGYYLTATHDHLLRLQEINYYDNSTQPPGFLVSLCCRASSLDATDRLTD